MSSVEELRSLIEAKGGEIRDAKAAKAPKEAITPLVADLLSLKEKYAAANGGVPYDPPKVDVQKKFKGPAQEASKKEGPSKSELNKLKRKEQKAAAKAADSAAKASGSATGKESGSSSNEDVVSSSQVQMLTSEVPTDCEVVFHASILPELSRRVSALSGDAIKFRNTQSKEKGAPKVAPHQPQLSSSNLGAVSGDLSIAKYIARTLSPQLYGADSWQASQVDQWLDLCNIVAVGALAPEGLGDLLNGHMAERTFVVGEELSLADLGLFCAIIGTAQGKKAVRKCTPTAAQPHLARWVALVSSRLPSVTSYDSDGAGAGAGSGAARSKAVKPEKSASGKASSGGAGAAGKSEEEEDTCPELWTQWKARW